MEHPKKEQIVGSFSTALSHLHESATLLRSISHSAANRVAQTVNEISDIVVEAVSDLPSSQSDEMAGEMNRPNGKSVDRRGSQSIIPCIPMGLAFHASPTMQNSSHEGGGSSQSQYQGYPSHRVIPAPVAPAATNRTLTSSYLKTNPSPAASNDAFPHLLQSLSTPRAKNAVKNSSSWAEVAAVKPIIANSTVDNFAFPRAVQHAVADTVAGTQLYAAESSSAPSSAIEESLDAQNRVVWITPMSPRDFTLLDITDQIPGGALNSVCFSETNEGEEGACVVFMLAECAQEFLNVHAFNCRKGRPTYGAGIDLYIGKPMPASPSIVAMLSTKADCARRRLTVSRRQLFHEVTRDKFEYQIERWVGDHNVELLFLYNMGNATVVLASVECAMVVKEKLEALGRRGGAYKGIVVSFSRDSTETPLHLISDIPNRNPAPLRRR